MHTLYTIMVYGALCVWRGGNDSSLGIWTKFAACTALVVGLFEYDRVFYTVFAPFEYLLGYTDPRRPNPNTMHEYVPSSPSCFAPPPLLMHLLQRRSTFGIQFTASHSARRFYFRAGLDRYVWIHGMICGYLHPTFENWLQAIDDKGAAVRRTIRAAIGAAAVLIMVAWYNTIYILPKLEYNQVHPYTSWIPITAFLILRNITPTLRLKSLGLYGWLGCITLETYVLCVPCIIYYRCQTIVWPSLVPQPVLPVVVSPWMITCVDSLICAQRLLATPWIQAIPYVAPVQGSQLPANISPLTPPRVSAGQFYGRDIALHLLGAPPVQDDGPAQRRHDSTRRRRIVAPKPDHVGSGRRLRLVDWIHRDGGR